MTRPPLAAGHTAQRLAPRAGRKSGPPEGRTTGRIELGRFAAFAAVSPEVGVLDEAALRRALVSDPAGGAALLVAMATATDEALRAAAIELSRRLILERGRAGAPRAHGVARLRLGEAEHGGDVDIEASFDRVLAARARGGSEGLDDLVSRQWGRPTTALVLVVDRSGSMHGDRLAIAAVVAAACAVRAPAEHCVLAFAGDVQTLRPLASDVPSGEVVDSLLRLRGHGVTRLAAALRAAGEQIASSRAARRVVVLLSDCRATDDDAIDVACSLPELLVLAPGDDHEQARQFATEAGGRWAAIDDPLAAAAALDALLRPDVA